MCKWKLRSSSKKFKSFLPPSLVFYPTFLALKFAQISCSQLIYAQLSMLQKWGKKLVRGVKNFWIVKYDISAFFCTKNHVKILKTCENRFTWKLEKIEMFFGWKQKFEKISFFWSRKFFSHFFQFSSKSIFASFKAFYIICCAKESWDIIFYESKVFYPPPSLVSCLPFLTSKQY